MATNIEEPIAENSDYVFQATIVGPDGTTPIESGIVSAITVSIRDVTSGEMIREDDDVLDALEPDGVFEMPLTPDDTRAIAGSGELQMRVMTFKITHSAGKKRNQEVVFHVDAMDDVPNTVIP